MIFTSFQRRQTKLGALQQASFGGSPRNLFFFTYEISGCIYPWKKNMESWKCLLGISEKKHRPKAPVKGGFHRPKVPGCIQIKSEIFPTYCWWFRNSKQPPEIGKTPAKKVVDSPYQFGAGFLPSTVSFLCISWIHVRCPELLKKVYIWNMRQHADTLTFSY